MNTSIHLKFPILAGCLIFSLVSQAQQNTVSAGGNGQSAAGSISYSVGQVAYISASGSNGNINQGVQQTYDIGVITGIEHTDVEATVFPNPTAGNIQLEIKESNPQNFEYLLFDVSGKLLLSSPTVNTLNSISLDGMSSGIYTLAVHKNGLLYKSFRIIRN